MNFQPAGHSAHGASIAATTHQQQFPGVCQNLVLSISTRARAWCCGTWESPAGREEAIWTKKNKYFFPFLKLLLITATVNLNKARREQCSTRALLHVLDVPNPREGGDDTAVVTSPSGLKSSPPGEGSAAEPKQKLPNPGTPRPSRAPPELANIHDFFFSFLQSFSSVPMAPGALSGKAHSEKEFILWLRDTGGIFCVGAPSVRTRRQQNPCVP